MGEGWEKDGSIWEKKVRCFLLFLTLQLGMCAPPSDRYAAPSDSRWLLRIAYQQLEARPPRSTIPEQDAVVPDADGSRSSGRGGRSGSRLATSARRRLGDHLITVRIPPAADARHLLRNALVAALGAVAQQLAQRRARPVVERWVARRGQVAGHGHAEHAAVDVLEATPAQQAQDIVRRRLQADVAVGRLHAHLELAHGAARAVAHIHQVEVEQTDFQVAARPQHALALRYRIAVGRL